MATLSDGRVSIGNLFRTYVNAVAASLPTGKSVAFIAYNYTSSPPDQPLASNVMPFMVHEPKVEIPRWDGKMSQCGLYFILYGGGYVIPNHWPHAMQEALQYGYAEGAKAAHGEFYGTWGPDGPKMWVYTNLLWNVDADVDDLLDDYYYHAYGPEAAPFMAEYFERAEAIYSRRKTATRYNFATTFPGEDQFAHATEEDFEVMEEAIADAQSSVVGTDNATRVDRVARCFQVGRMYWDQFQTLRSLAASEVHSESDLDDVMALAESFYTQDAARQDYWTNEVAPYTEYCVPAGNNANSANPQFHWNELAPSMDAAFREITRYKQSIGETPQEIYDFWMGVASSSSTLASFAETQLLYAANKNPSLTNFVTNPSFEESTTDPIMAAQDWVKEPAGTPSTAMFRDTTEAHSGGASLGIEGTAGTFGVRQRVALFNGRRYRLSFWYKTASPDMSVRYVLHNINGFLPGSVEWKSFDRILTANGNPLILSPLILTMNPGQFASQIWFDDVKVELLAPEGVQGYFEQDFSASTSLSAYKNITNYNMSPNAPTVDRFNDLSTGSGSWAISSGRLRLNRTGTANGGFTRLSGPVDQAPKIQYARFDLGVNLKGAASTDTLANIDFGDFQSVTSYDSTSVSDVSNRLQIKGTGTNFFGLTMNGVTQGSYAANGSSLSITWVINQSDTEEQYEGLDSSPRTVSPNRSDVWVGNTLLFNNVTRPAGLGGNRVGGVRFQTTGTQSAEFSFDNFLFEPVMGAAGLLTQNFAASTSVANYVDASNPSVGEFHDISAESKGGTWAITSGDRFLHLARTHVGPDSDNGAGFMKLNQGFPSQPNVVTAQFDLAVDNDLHVFGTFGYLDFGSFTSLTDYNSTTLTGISNRISIRGGGSHKYRFEYNGVVLPAVGDAFVADGTPTRITWVMNHSGSTQTYRGVDGSLRDLDHHHSDFWVGDTLLFSNAPRLSSLPSGNTSVGAFRFRSTYPDKVDLYFGNFDFQRELPR